MGILSANMPRMIEPIGTRRAGDISSFEKW